MPEPIVATLNATFAKALLQPKVRARLAALDFRTEGGGAQAFRAGIAAGMENDARGIREARISLD